ncbi:MAG: GNAT family N-acetyltransferase [Candidatus Paceibacterota bacterium]|jgi:ribosomal protein S18 acetylase RimI-like enzyme
MTDNYIINEFISSDRAGVEQCISELQEHERKIDSNKKTGEEVAESYLQYLLGECRENNGRIFVAKMDSEVVGFSCVWVEDEDDPTSKPRKIGYFSDLYVMPQFRRHGIGSGLIHARKDYLKSLGVSLARVCTLANNPEIQEALKSQGFNQYEIIWEISL